MASNTVELAAKDLNREGGVYCPNPLAKMELWNAHPRVFLNLARTGQAACPYCGTHYQLKAGEHVAAHH